MTTADVMEDPNESIGTSVDTIHPPLKYRNLRSLMTQDQAKNEELFKNVALGDEGSAIIKEHRIIFCSYY